MGPWFPLHQTGKSSHVDVGWLLLALLLSVVAGWRLEDGHVLTFGFYRKRSWEELFARGFKKMPQRVQVPIYEILRPQSTHMGGTLRPKYVIRSTWTLWMQEHVQ